MEEMEHEFNDSEYAAAGVRAQDPAAAGAIAEARAATEKVPDSEFRRLVIVDNRLAPVDRVRAKARAVCAREGDECVAVECKAVRPYQGRRSWSEFWMLVRIKARD